MSNDINELTAREINGGGDHELTYDDVGNIEDRQLTPGTSGTKYVYKHDGWNRLVAVDFVDNGTTKARAEYRYNGLHHRIIKKADLRGATSNDPPDGTFDQQRVMLYTTGWQLIQENINDNLDVDANDDRRMEMFFAGSMCCRRKRSPGSGTT